jgi:DNA-binding transcriptional LysR family regulator
MGGDAVAAFPNGMLNDASVLSLRSFVAVVETQSFSSAARQLRLAPSSVTKHVQMLERALNLALFYRTTRRISVTEAGERFYDHCLTILAQVDGAAALMVEERALIGHLRVTAPPSFALTVLGPNIHAFLDEHPGITVDMIVTSATPNLIRDRIDVAIMLHEEPESKLAQVLLAVSPREVCASPAYLARHGAPASPEDLDRHQCLSSRFSGVAETWSFARGAASWVVNVKSRLLSDNGDILRRACLAGAGIGNFYRFHVLDDLRAGRLVRVLPDFTPKPKDICAVIPHRQLLRPQTKAFIAFAKQAVAGRAL